MSTNEGLTLGQIRGLKPGERVFEASGRSGRVSNLPDRATVGN